MALEKKKKTIGRYSGPDTAERFGEVRVYLPRGCAGKEVVYQEH